MAGEALAAGIQALGQVIGSSISAVSNAAAAGEAGAATRHASDQDLAARDLESSRQLAAAKDTNRTQLTQSREDGARAKQIGNQGAREMAQLFDSIDRGLRTDCEPGVTRRTAPHAGRGYDIPHPARV